VYYGLILTAGYFDKLRNYGRVPNTPGNPGNLLELFFLLEIYWKFTVSPGNFLV